MTYLDRSLSDVLAAFSDPAPTPGGGSASALAAALGLSLFAMVAQMGRTRSGTDEDRRALDRAKAALLPLREHAAQLITDDAAAYDAVVAAYRLPKATEEEKSARRAAIQNAMRAAAEVPLDVMRTCQAGVTAATDVSRHGNPSASSDIGVALELLTAALRGAALNVRVNLGSIDEVGSVDGARAEVERLEAAFPLLVEEVRGGL